MGIIDAVTWRRIYNSHLQPTTEYAIKLRDGTTGVGASPQGETISIYEDDGTPVDAQTIVATVARDFATGRELDQTSFDEYLQTAGFGKNTCYALSLAFFDAQAKSDLGGRPRSTRANAPRLCCNILNGG